MSSAKEATVRAQVVSTAIKMVSGEMPLIEGARTLCSLRHEVSGSNSNLFDPIVGFESETDDYPLGAQRQAYSRQSLIAMDREMAEYLAKVRPVIVQACRELVATFRPPASAD